MSDGTITYDYPVIEQCLEKMTSKAQQIEQQTTDLESDVKRIMVDWHGSTADAYDSLSKDLANDLTQNVSNLQNLRRNLNDSAERMKSQDAKGGQALQ